jgi:S-adenosylmethionine synthetase
LLQEFQEIKLKSSESISVEAGDRKGLILNHPAVLYVQLRELLTRTCCKYIKYNTGHIALHYPLEEERRDTGT